jgi:hypothetical protein
MVREMYLSLLLPPLFHFLTLFAVVPVRVLFKPVMFQKSFSYFCFTMWQFVNADASHGSHSSRHGLLRSQQRDVIHDRPRAVPTVQTTGLPGNWQYSGCLVYVFLAFLCTFNR